MSRRSIRQAMAKREPGLFVAVPMRLLQSEQFARLGPYAVKLLCDLLAQYRLNNNGDLCATWAFMEKRGWRSRATLDTALKELVERGFIVQTRQGGRHCASLYAVTFFSFDRHAKLDMLPSDFTKGLWTKKAPGDGARRRESSHRPRVNAGRIDTADVSKTSGVFAIDTAAVSVERPPAQSVTPPACTFLDLPSPSPTLSVGAGVSELSVAPRGRRYLFGVAA